MFKLFVICTIYSYCYSLGTPYNRDEIDDMKNASRLKYVEKFFTKKIHLDDASSGVVVANSEVITDKVSEIEREPPAKKQKDETIDSN